MNPWQSAAESYQQGLQGLGQVQQQGYRDMANAPLKLYQMFMDGYEKARQRKMQEEQLARQNRLADVQEQRADEQERQNKMANRMKIAEYVSKTLRGDKQSYDEVMSNLKGSSFEDLIPKPADDQGGEELAGPVKPGEQPLRRLPNLQYPMGLSYRMQMEKEAQDKEEFARKQDEIERRNVALEEERKAGRISAEEAKRVANEIRQQQLDLQRQMQQQGIDFKYASLAQGRELGLARLDMQRQGQETKRTMEQGKAEAALVPVYTGIDQTLGVINELKSHPGLKAATGKTWLAGSIPGTDAKGAANLIQNLKTKLWFTTMNSMKTASSTGATGLGQITEQENKRIEMMIANLDPSAKEEEFMRQLNKVEEAILKMRENIDKQYRIKFGGGGGGANNLDLRQQALEAIKQRPEAAAQIKASYKQKTGEDL